MKQPMQVLTSQDTEEWFTPPEYVELARLVLFGIELDPASDPRPQEWIQAETFWTKADDGLNRPWHGTVWLNPPYGTERGRSRMDLWTRKLEDEVAAGRVAAGIALINSAPGYAWFERLWRRWPVCMVEKRISFLRPDGKPAGQAKKGQAFVLFATEPHGLLAGRARSFERVFSSTGRIIVPDYADWVRPLTRA